MIDYKFYSIEYIILDEIWQDIPNYIGYYSISNYGRIKSEDRHICSKIGQKYFHKGRFLRPKYIGTKTLNGQYLGCTLSVKGQCFYCYIHQLVAITYLGPRLLGYEIHHKNTNKKDNRLINLEYVLKSQHKQKHLGCQDGEKNHRCILSTQDVIDIRALYKKGSVTKKKLSYQFNVGRRHIGSIVNYESRRNS